MHLATSPGELLDATADRESIAAHPLSMDREINIRRDILSLIRWIILVYRLKPDVLNVGTPKASLLGLVAGYLCRVPTRIYVVRGLRHEGVSGQKRVLLAKLELFRHWLATDTVIVSKSMADVLHQEGIPDATLTLIGEGSSNGVNSERFFPPTPYERQCLRKEWGIPENIKIGLFVGRLTPDKGLTTLVNAFKLVSGCHVKLAVAGRVEDESTELELTSIDTFSLGWQKNMRDVFCLADFLILPTRREGFPNVVLEAALCCLPTITTDATGAVDSVVNGETGLIFPVDDHRYLAHQINKLVHDENLLHRLGNNARERALKEFSPIRVWRGLEAIYEGQRTSDISTI